MSTYYVRSPSYFFFFFNDTATTEIYTLSLHDALPISLTCSARTGKKRGLHVARDAVEVETGRDPTGAVIWLHGLGADGHDLDRKSTRLNSSHDQISYAVFCLKKKKSKRHQEHQSTQLQ